MKKTKHLRSANKTMGIFTSEDHASQAVKQLSLILSNDASRIILVEPNDPALEDKLKNEYTHMGQAAIATHLWSALIGVTIGAIFWATLYYLKVPIFVHEAPTALLGSICVFLLIGVLIGCVMAYMPKGNSIIQPTEKAVSNGKWVVMAYPISSRESKAAMAYFSQLKPLST